MDWRVRIGLTAGGVSFIVVAMLQMRAGHAVFVSMGYPPDDLRGIGHRVGHRTHLARLRAQSRMALPAHLDAPGSAPGRQTFRPQAAGAIGIVGELDASVVHIGL